jgi:hypothetical protein
MTFAPHVSLKKSTAAIKLPNKLAFPSGIASQSLY